MPRSAHERPRGNHPVLLLLDGQANVVIGDETVSMGPREGIEIGPGTPHREPAIGEVLAALAARDSHRAGSSHPAPL